MNPDNREPTQNLSRLHRLNHICDDFEEAWVEGNNPKIEDYLARAHPAERENLLAELLRTEFEYLLRTQGTVDVRKYHDRFPDTLVLVDQAWEKVSEMSGSRGERTIAHSQARRSVPEIPDIPGYQLLEEIGRGGMGVVYKARQLQPRRLVAIKMLLSGAHADDELLGRFLSEAEAVARLQHPNIVCIYEVRQKSEHPFLSLEFIDGGNLRQYLQQHTISEEMAVRIVLQLARGVHHAHARGILHRDIKPANILLQPIEESDGSELPFLVKLTDFGLAKHVAGISSIEHGPKTQSGTILGTPSYMAPEQIQTRGENLGPEVDVYALGAILYEMLTNQPPFQGSTVLEILRKVMDEKAKPVRQLAKGTSRDLETICMRCLRKDPTQRFRSAADLISELNRYLVGKQPLSKPSRLATSESTWKLRHRLMYSAGAVFLIVVMIMIGLILNMPGSRSTQQKQIDVSERDNDSINAASNNGNPNPRDQKVLLATSMKASLSNLKQMAKATHDWHAVNGTLPPPYITDSQTKKPLLSWRVIILPYLGQTALYQQFKLDESWDSPHNIKLLPKIPDQYQTHWGAKITPSSTYYRVFVGPGTAFEPNHSTPLNPFGFAGWKINDLTDGTMNTLLIIEASEAVPWTKPDELQYAPKIPLPPLCGPYENGFHAAMGDGSAKFFVMNELTQTTLRNAITRNDGQRLGNDWLEASE